MRTRGRRGATLILSLLAMSAFSLLAGIVYYGARSSTRGAAYALRQAQAQAIAEAGVEDAMTKLYQNYDWTAGFTQKSFAGGYYTVIVTTTSSAPNLTVTGYSPWSFPTGRAVRTVFLQTSFTNGSCPYAIFADDITLQGKLDAYDPTASLTPCSTCFFAAADTWANNNMTITGAACPPTRLRGAAYIGGGHSLSGSSACVENGVSLSTQTKALPNWSGAGAANFTVNAGSTATLYPGTYNFKKLTVRGVLNVDTTTGTVYINFDSNVDANAGCQINNLSKRPSRLHITDVSGNSGHTINLTCSTPLHAYLEGNTNRFDIEQEVYGHYCGGSVNISSTTGKIGIVHWDQGGGVLNHVAIKAGTWTESYRRQ